MSFTAITRRLPAWACGAVIVAGLLAPAATAALGASSSAGTQGFQISPPVTTLSLNRGTSTRGTMKVTNLTGQTLTLTVGKENFVAQGEEGQVELTDNADPLYSLAPYFTLSTSQISVAPTATVSVGYTISVPINAEPGGRYGSVTFTSIPAALPSGQSGAAVRQQLAGLILLRINGPTHEQLAVASFTTGKSFYEYGPVTFTTRVQNEGNVHELPTGQIVVKNLFGLTTAKLTLDQHYVLPGAIRRLTNTLNRHFLFGPYTATLTLHNGTLQTLTATTKFTVIPYKLLTIALVILVLVILFFWKARKRLARALRILAGRE
jgi:hypothetical protein